MVHVNRRMSVEVYDNVLQFTLFPVRDIYQNMWRRTGEQSIFMTESHLRIKSRKGGRWYYCHHIMCNVLFSLLKHLKYPIVSVLVFFFWFLGGRVLKQFNFVKKNVLPNLSKCPSLFFLSSLPYTPYQVWTLIGWLENGATKRAKSLSPTLNC